MPYGKTISQLPLDPRAAEIYRGLKTSLYARTDRAFALLFVLQWFVGIGVALLITPTRWEGSAADTHPHVFAAVFLGALTCLFPAAWALSFPGQKLTRNLVGICQMLAAAIFIHLTGGRIESHFLVFGALAFLSIYRDPQVLIVASVVTAADHMLRGLYWPESIYGIEAAFSWRWLEHSAYVVFEDVFLLYSCVRSNRELKDISRRQADLERVNQYIEAEVSLRTRELVESHALLESERARSVQSSKMAALGEMAAGIAHEINNPVAAISLSASEIDELREDGTLTPGRLQQLTENIGKSTERVSKIIHSLQSLSRDGAGDPLRSTPLANIVSETVALCTERFRRHNVTLFASEVPAGLRVLCRPGEISQVILNLLHNAMDAAEESEGRWVRLEFRAEGMIFELAVVDSGTGVPESVREKIFQPFFTTKEVGKGTGLGLSISTRIMKAHGGSLDLDASSGSTRFRLLFPKEAAL